MKPPKFLITHNEAAQPGAAFIVHTQEPSFVGRIITFEDEEELNQFVNNNDCIIINEQVVVHIYKYLTSNEFNRIEGLNERLKHWILKNWIQD
ncbi:hypothetical protein P1X15_09910 [Runella sp. MFBS21]|uniref:hypothetical protein n=1 Tax=Runella sp. MFBS21 TaxID=3034018 RepID=UPI0023F8BCAE|nr:hypothetical protein [Runella sp. MFBS21]MDF7817912.1 hypothetical protein [Runella sp. MFBS21]